MGGDLNSYMGRNPSSYRLVHGGFGYDVRNKRAEKILDFATSLSRYCKHMFQKQ